jgi:ectoine hydroxylase-related dioxygenase (phytanoyl-CoA dioxygenase family)
MTSHATIPEFDASDKGADIARALDGAGCVVVHGVLELDAVEDIRRELAEPMAATQVQDEDKPEDFYPAKTRRVTALMARAPSTHPLALDPIVGALCDHHLGPNCERYQLHVSAALEIGPGAREQILHREEDPFTYFPVPRPNLVLATMWAISDFTKQNGATLLAPGSHRWEKDREAEPNEVVSAEMPKGSMLVWLGGTFHGAGANVSNQWRYGVILSYSLGWLRQEENMYLDLPADIANEMPAEIRELAGYPMHGSLGFYDPTL